MAPNKTALCHLGENPLFEKIMMAVIGFENYISTTGRLGSRYRQIDLFLGLCGLRSEDLRIENWIAEENRNQTAADKARRDVKNHFYRRLCEE